MTNNWVSTTGFFLVAIFVLLELQNKLVLGTLSHCQIPALYNFGDSNSDTGSASAVFGTLSYPYGITFFGKPYGRVSDGRLIIDFIAEKLGLPYLSAYMDAIEGNFRHGANFAASGTTIQPVDEQLYGFGANPLSLNIQLLQFQQLKERASEIYKKGQSSVVISRLPRPEDFSKALYTFDIGQNDLVVRLNNMTEDQVLKSIQELIGNLALAMQKLYLLGARRFWIHNTGPIGCLPFVVSSSPPESGHDENGCLKSHNEVAQEFNRLLKDKVSEMRAQLPDSLLVYVDIYSAKYTLIANAKANGFIGPFEFCCEDCGKTQSPYWERHVIVNDTEVSATPCDTPSEYISWDSVHYTEAANQWVTERILNGSFTDPPMPIKRSSSGKEEYDKSAAK